MKFATILFGLSILLPNFANAQDAPPAFSIEGGVMSPSDPTAAFGVLCCDGDNRGFARFAYLPSGRAQKVDGGIERVIYKSKWLDFLSRGVAGVGQDANQDATWELSGQVGPQVKLPFGLSIVALVETGRFIVNDDPVSDDADWKSKASLTLRWKP